MNSSEEPNDEGNDGAAAPRIHPQILRRSPKYRPWRRPLKQCHPPSAEREATFSTSLDQPFRFAAESGKDAGFGDVDGAER